MIENATLRALLVAYVKGEDGGVSVLNDFLEEAGRQGVTESCESATRIDAVMRRFLSPDEELLIGCEFLEHALPKIGFREGVAAVESAVTAIRDRVAGQLTQTELAKVATELFGAWRGHSESERDILWAAFALARRSARPMRRALLNACPEEVGWQVECTASFLDRP